MTSTIELECRQCRGKLIELKWNSACYIYICDNTACALYRTPQGHRLKEDAPSTRSQQMATRSRRLQKLEDTRRARGAKRGSKRRRT